MSGHPAALAPSRFTYALPRLMAWLVVRRKTHPRTTTESVSFEKAPGVPAGHRREPSAKPAVLWQLVHVLNQDGKRELRDVGCVLHREPVFSGYGVH